MKAPDDVSVVTVVHAYQKHNPEGWTAIVEHSGPSRTKVLEKIIAILGRRDVEMWAYKATDDSLHGLLRVSPAEQLKLMNCKDLTLFFRPFVLPGNTPGKESDIVLLWASKVQNTNELATIANTLRDVHGYIANKSSIGIRVSKASLGAARQALVRTSSRFSQANSSVSGEMRWAAHGFPPQWSAKTVVEAFGQTHEQSKWTPWNVVPFRSTTSQQRTTWYLKADTEPSQKRLILPTGDKILICKIDTPQEAWVKSQTFEAEKRELHKATRRQKIVAAACQPTTEFSKDDPWAGYQKTEATAPRSSRSSSSTFTGVPSSASDSAVADLQKQFAAMSVRMDQQEKRMDIMDSTMAGNHNEVMTMLRAIAGNTAPGSSPSGKRPPEVASSLLKAITDGRGRKEQRQ